MVIFRIRDLTLKTLYLRPKSEQNFRIFGFFTPFIIIATLQKQIHLPIGKPSQKTTAHVLMPTKSQPHDHS